MATPHYQQCLLIKNNINKIAMIPIKFARIGKMLKLKEDGIWSAGWKVAKLYAPILGNEMELVTSTQRRLHIQLTPP